MFYPLREAFDTAFRLRVLWPGRDKNPTNTRSAMQLRNLHPHLNKWPLAEKGNHGQSWLYSLGMPWLYRANPPIWDLPKMRCLNCLNHSYIIVPCILPPTNCSDPIRNFHLWPRRVQWIHFTLLEATGSNFMWSWNGNSCKCMQMFSSQKVPLSQLFRTPPFAPNCEHMQTVFGFWLGYLGLQPANRRTPGPLAIVRPFFGASFAPENEARRPWNSCAAAIQFFQVPLPHPKLGHCRSTAQGKCQNAPGRSQGPKHRSGLPSPLSIGEKMPRKKRRNFGHV